MTVGTGSVLMMLLTTPPKYKNFYSFEPAGADFTELENSKKVFVG